jgi:predicted transcriptional regulator
MAMDQQEEWVPTPDELRMIDEGIRDVEQGRICTSEEVRQRLNLLRAKLESDKERDSA